MLSFKNTSVLEERYGIKSILTTFNLSEIVCGGISKESMDKENRAELNAGEMGLGDLNLFDGTAPYYSRYRVPYPDVLVNSLTEGLQLNGTRRMLDVGCGTGEVIEALGSKFEAVVGVDQDLSMLNEARKRMKRANLSNVELRLMSAKDIGSIPGKFLVVTFGSSFHWTDREATAGLVLELLQPGGALVILGSNSPWKGKEEWQKIAVDKIREWLGEERRAGKGMFKESSVTHEDILKETGYIDVKTVEFDHPYVWKLDNFIGYLYSTSFASKKVLGDKAEAFEADLRKTLLAYDSRGEYPEQIKFYYSYGKKPR